MCAKVHLQQTVCFSNPALSPLFSTSAFHSPPEPHLFFFKDICSMILTLVGSRQEKNSAPSGIFKLLSVLALKEGLGKGLIAKLLFQGLV